MRKVCIWIGPLPLSAARKFYTNTKNYCQKLKSFLKLFLTFLQSHSRIWTKINHSHWSLGIGLSVFQSVFWKYLNRNQAFTRYQISTCIKFICILTTQKWGNIYIKCQIWNQIIPLFSRKSSDYDRSMPNYMVTKAILEKYSSIEWQRPQRTYKTFWRNWQIKFT